MLTLGLLSSAPRLATAGAPQAFDFERQVSLLRCVTGPADRQSSAALQRPFVLELVVETKTQRIPTLPIARTTDELRRTLESPPPQPRHDPPVSIGRWRVIDAGGRNAGIFDQASLALCKRGCALHKAQGVDTTQWIFVLAKPEERRLDVRWDLREVEKYGTPYAVVTWVGYRGGYYVLQNPSNTMTPEKGWCSS
jgi:hypothetical protein